MPIARPLIAYFLLTFALSWVFFTPAFLDWIGGTTPLDRDGYYGFAGTLSAFGPMAAALILLGRHGGWRSAWGLVRSGVDFRIRPILLLIAILLPISSAWITTTLVTLTGLDNLPGSMVPADFGYPAIFWLVPAFISMMVFGGGQEEFGWRGYAQRPMQRRWGFLPGGLSLGAIWGVWHLPLWIIPGDPHVFIPFPVFVIFTMAFSIHIHWLFRLSGYKLAIPWIMHGVQNTVLIVFPVYRLDHAGTQVGLYFYVGLSVVIAAIIAITEMRRTRPT